MILGDDSLAARFLLTGHVGTYPNLLPVLILPKAPMMHTIKQSQRDIEVMCFDLTETLSITRQDE